MGVYGAENHTFHAVQSTQSASCLQWHMHAQCTCGLVLRWTAMHYCNIANLG